MAGLISLEQNTSPLSHPRLTPTAPIKPDPGGAHLPKAKPKFWFKPIAHPNSLGILNIHIQLFVSKREV